MRDDIGYLGHMAAQEVFHLVQVADPGHHIERLPAPEPFAHQRLADGDRVELADIGANGQPVDRGRGDDRQVAHAGQGQLQRARNGRRGQGQDMHLGPHFLQPLLVGDAKVLFLVDDQQPQLLEADPLGQQRVGADDDVHRAIGHCSPRGIGVAR